jgi:hypothetical protein
VNQVEAGCSVEGAAGTISSDPNVSPDALEDEGLGVPGANLTALGVSQSSGVDMSYDGRVSGVIVNAGRAPGIVPVLRLGVCSTLASFTTAEPVVFDRTGGFFLTGIIHRQTR